MSLKIIGDGPEYARLKCLIDEDIEPNVHFLGAIYDEQKMAEHFLGADLFLVTGAAGLSVNHALAYDVPIAAFARTKSGPFHHPEIEYVVPGRTGILVTQYTNDALANGIDQFLENVDLASMRKGIREFVDKTISLGIVADNFGKLLRILEPSLAEGLEG